MTLIPVDGFKKFAPKAPAGKREALEEAAAAEGFCGLTLAHWLGQMYVESGGFSTMVESLNYSPDGLMKTFGPKRISRADADKFGRIPGRPAHQNAIANIVYGGEYGRKNLGNTQPGDGWRFRGGGDKQITGRANHREAGYEDNPDVLKTDMRAAAKAAANFFVKHGCVAPAMKDDVKGVTLTVNGGLNGYPDRITATASAKRMLGL